MRSAVTALYIMRFGSYTVAYNVFCVCMDSFFRSHYPPTAACRSRGRYLVALGRSWHPEEFTCSQCKVVLEVGGFFEERGSIFCTKCYDGRYAPNCAKCRRKITGVSRPPVPLANENLISV